MSPVQMLSSVSAIRVCPPADCRVDAGSKGGEMAHNILFYIFFTHRDRPLLPGWAGRVNQREEELSKGGLRPGCL